MNLEEAWERAKGLNLGGPIRIAIEIHRNANGHACVCRLGYEEGETFRVVEEGLNWESIFERGWK